MSWEGDVLAGLAGLLHTAGVGTYAAGTLADPDAAGVTIVLGGLPLGTGRVIALADYPVADDPNLTDVIIGVQVMIRATESPGVLRELRAAVHDALHGRRGSIGGRTVSQVWRNSGTILGPDDRGLLVSTDSYYIQGNRAHAHRSD